MPVTEHGSPYLDGPCPDGRNGDGSQAYGVERTPPLDPVARVDLQRAQQARYGTDAHPDAALLASRLVRAVDSSVAPHAVWAGAAADPATATTGPPAAVLPAGPHVAAGPAV